MYEPIEMDSDERDYDSFFLGAGKSPFKNTEGVLNTWYRHEDYPKLYVTCFEGCERYFNKYLKFPLEDIKNAKNIIYFDTPLDKEEFTDLKSKIVGNLCPSIAEGYGHYINEARINKSVIITVDGPPMNELVDDSSGILIPAEEHINEKNFSSLFYFEEKELEKAVKRYMSMSKDDKIAMGKRSYQRYIEDTYFFKERMNYFYEYICGNIDEKKMNFY